MQLNKTQFEALSNRMIQSVFKVLIRNILDLHYLQCNVTAKQCKSDEIQWIKRSSFLSVGLECPRWKSNVLYSCALQSSTHALWKSVAQWLVISSSTQTFSSPSLSVFLYFASCLFSVSACFLLVCSKLHVVALINALSFCVCVTGSSQAELNWWMYTKYTLYDQSQAQILCSWKYPTAECQNTLTTVRDRETLCTCRDVSL